MRIKWVMRVDTIQRFFRVCRVMWERGVVGDGEGYSAKFSVAISPHVFSPIRRDAKHDWRVTILGVRLHYARSYGGVFA